MNWIYFYVIAIVIFIVTEIIVSKIDAKRHRITKEMIELLKKRVSNLERKDFRETRIDDVVDALSYSYKTGLKKSYSGNDWE